jgi:diguanylate cyclase (GGDEF)-like protein
MTPTEVTSLLGGLSRACQQQLYAEDDFRRELQSILTRLHENGLVVRSRVDANPGAGGFETIAEYGGPKNDDIDALGINIHTEGSYRFTIEGWCHREVESFDAQRSREMYQAAFQPLVSILTEHWGKRDPMTLLPTFKVSGQQQRLEKAIRAASLDGGPITAVHLDLDFFKKVNTEFGEPGGDAVLREFGTRIRSAFGDDSIAVRKGGEEFSLFFPRAGLSSVLPRVERFRQFMEVTNFAHISRPNTCSSGIASFPLHVGVPKPPKELADALLDEIMAAESRAKAEGRNCIRLAGPIQATQGDETEHVVRNDLVEAALWARQNLSPHDAPCFGTELHTFLAEFLVDRFRNAAVEQLVDVLDNSIQTFGIRAVLSRSTLDYTTANADPFVHAVKLASIAVHALLRLAMSGAGPLGSGDQLYLAVTDRGGTGKSLAIIVRRTGKDIGHVKVRDTALPQTDLEVYAGRVWSPQGEQSAGVPRWVPPTKGVSLAPVLLLAIGQPSLQLHLQPWAAAVVEVDDRPVSGGGLPDFWQSNFPGSSTPR